MLELLELELVNFRSWKHLLLTDLNNRGLCLIKGANGSGKSSIRQSIEYLLSDKTSDNIPLDELPRNKIKSCMMKCNIQKGDSIIEIVKYRNHKEKGNHIALSIDGDPSLTQTDRRDTQRNIETTLGITYNTLFASTIFSQNSVSFPDAKETERKNILYEIKDLSKYEQYAQIAKIEENKIKEDIVNIRGQIESIDYKIDFLNNEIKKYEESYHNFESDCDKKIDELLEDIYFIEDNISSTNKEIGNLEVNEFNEKVYTELQEMISQTENIIHDFTVERSEATTQLNRIKDNKCPLLGESCEFLSDEILRVKDEIEPKIKRLDLELDRSKSTLNSFKEKENELLKLKEKKEVTDKKKFELERRLSILLQDKEHLEDRIKGIRETKNPYNSSLEEAENELDNNKSLKQNLVNRLNKYVESLPYYSFWTKGFGKQGIPNMKIEGFLDVLENETNRYLSQISDQMFVQIESQSQLKSNKESREKISYKVLHPDKSITDYKSYSGGQKQRIKIADLFAFSKLVGKFSFILLDEVLELSLDNKGVDLVLDALRECSSDFDSIFVVSHNSTVQNRFDNILSVGIDNGASYIR